MERKLEAALGTALICLEGSERAKHFMYLLYLFMKEHMSGFQHRVCLSTPNHMLELMYSLAYGGVYTLHVCI